MIQLAHTRPRKPIQGQTEKLVSLDRNQTGSFRDSPGRSGK